MRRKRIFWQALPVVAVAVCFALPMQINHALLHSIGVVCSALGRSFSQATVKERGDGLRLWQLEEENRNLRAGIVNQEPAQTLTARVIFRAYNSWSSALWIDKGSADNTDRLILAKNSPVLSGDSVVGVVDYVGKHVSLVRLITDSGICPAVRVARKSHHNELLQQVEMLLETNELAFEKPEEKIAFSYLLNKLYNREPQAVTWLAKGELQGHGEPLWRSPGKLLKGIGFNYDWKDEEGPARDLRSGEPLDPDKEYDSRPAVSLIQLHDLLVTSGFDGLFPPGLQVATVELILPLKEGDCAYEIRAKPTASNMLDLEYVSILPPQRVQQEHLPDRVGRIIEQIDRVM